MQVMKFGGSSVATAQAMARVVDIVRQRAVEDRTILVLSAISGCTDALIAIGHKAAAADESYRADIDTLQERHHTIIRELLPHQAQERALADCDQTFGSIRDIAQGVYLLGELSPTSLDAIQGCGELLSTRIVATRLSSLGVAVKWADSRKIIRTTVVDGLSVVDNEATRAAAQALLEAHPAIQVFVLPGFIASDSMGRMTTLGRGGSDYSASLLAVSVQARKLEIWTDVPGMLTCNPKAVPGARTIPHISYRAALELSHFGAKVIYPPTIQPVVSQGIPIYVKNTFDPSAHGTLIEKDPPRSASPITGIANSDNIALLSLEGSGMVGIPGFSSRLFDTLSRCGVNIILITQASSVHTMCIAVAEKDAEKAREAADHTFAYEISLGKLNPLKVEKGYSIVCLVGDDIRSQTGTTGRMLAALGRDGISVRATAQGSSERNISVIIPSGEADPALRCLHSEFFDKKAGKVFNLFLAGYGGVGRALVGLLLRNADAIEARTGRRLRVIGLSNSRRYVLDARGIDLSKADELLAAGISAADGAYFEALAGLSMKHKIFVDCSASYDVAYRYESLMQQGFSVVASNKLAFAMPFERYAHLQATALEEGAALRYETTVGAALPILSTIRQCVNSGDRIVRVEAVLSGTLGFLFSTYKGGSFEMLVRQAREAGYTEPDPRVDLSGKDVLRKLIILAREAGIPLEEAAVQQSPILPESWFEGDVEAFFSCLRENEAWCRDSFGSGRLRYVASLEISDDGSYTASVGLREVSGPLAALEGTLNAAVITSDFYPGSLLIQGAGAGALQTAQGVLNDILS